MVTKNPLVTVGVITYNQERYIGLTLDSILAQDYRPLKIIVADDCSIDSTSKILREYKNNYPDQIDIKIHERNVGISENLLSLFANIDGKYFCWIGGDDYFLPNKLSQQVRYMAEHPDCVLCYHDVQVFDQGGNLYTYNDALLGQKAYEGYISGELIRHRCFISALSMMVDVTKIDNLKPTTVAICSDWLFFIETAMKGKIGYIPEILGAYRRHSENITKKIDVTFEENVFIYLQDRYPELSKDIGKGQAWFYVSYTIKYFLAGRMREGSSTIIKFIQTIFRTPVAITFVLGRLFSQLINRVALWAKTGSAFR